MDFLNGDENEVLNEGHFGYQKVKGNMILGKIELISVLLV